MTDELTTAELLDACIEESTRVVHRGTSAGYSAAELRILENQVVIMRALRELRGER